MRETLKFWEAKVNNIRSLKLKLENDVVLLQHIQLGYRKQSLGSIFLNFIFFFTSKHSLMRLSPEMYLKLMATLKSHQKKLQNIFFVMRNVSYLCRG